MNWKYVNIMQMTTIRKSSKTLKALQQLRAVWTVLAHQQSISLLPEIKNFFNKIYKQVGNIK